MIQNANPTTAATAAQSGAQTSAASASTPADGFSALLAAIFGTDPALAGLDPDAAFPSELELALDAQASAEEREQQLRAAALAASIAAPFVQAAMQGAAETLRADTAVAGSPDALAGGLTALGAPAAAAAMQGPIAAFGVGDFLAQEQAEAQQLAAATADSSANAAAGSGSGSSLPPAAPASPEDLARALAELGGTTAPADARAARTQGDAAETAAGNALSSQLARSPQAQLAAASGSAGGGDELQSGKEHAGSHAASSRLRAGDAFDARSAAGADPLATLPFARLASELDAAAAPAAMPTGGHAGAQPMLAATAVTSSHATARMPEPPSAGTPGTAAGAPVAPEALPLHVEWLAERGGGTAVVDLHPPHLGRVEISVRVVGDEVEVSISSQDSQVQGVLDAQRGNLEQSLADRNLRMTLFDLGLSGSPNRGFANASRDPHPNARERRGAEVNTAPRMSAAGETAVTATSARSPSGVDLHA